MDSWSNLIMAWPILPDQNLIKIMSNTESEHYFESLPHFVNISLKKNYFEKDPSFLL